MKARVKWSEDRTFIGTSGSGHSVVFGTTHGETTQPPGPRPMELILIGTAGCSVYDVVGILEKTRQKVDDVIVEINGDRADATPAVFTRIHMHFIVKGHDVDAKKVERAINLSVEKYCSATAMMAKTAEVTHDFEIVETAE
ncbi:MAG: OsmC family protein [Paracoccaceae bacterium]|nr:OsmC family protein [Paracoccaceae bacterium]